MTTDIGSRQLHRIGLVLFGVVFLGFAATLGVVAARAVYIGCVGLCVLAACGTDDVSPPYVTTSDSGGASIVEHSPQIWAQVEGWELSDTPLVDISRSTSASDHDLFRVRSISRLSTGEIVVASAGTHEILIYDTTGHHVRTIGRQGSGPGEFNALALAEVISGDSIVAYDELQHRITVFTPDGTAARSILVVTGHVRHVFRDGALLVTSVQLPTWEPGVLRQTITLFHVSPTGEVLDTLGRFPGSEFFVQPEAQYLEYRPFGRRFETAVGDSVLHAGTNDRYEIRVFSRQGAVRTIVRSRVSPERVTLEIFDAFITEQIAAARDPRRREEFRRLRRVKPYPETMPAHGSLCVGAEGDLWVEDYRANPHSVPRWRVFDDAGMPVAVVEPPRDFSVMSVGSDWVAGVWKDEADVEHVQVYRLLRR